MLSWRRRQQQRSMVVCLESSGGCGSSAGDQLLVVNAAQWARHLLAQLHRHASARSGSIDQRTMLGQMRMQEEGRAGSHSTAAEQRCASGMLVLHLLRVHVIAAAEDSRQQHQQQELE